MAIILLATSWGNANGGVNAFNCGLASGLATIQEDTVCCAVTDTDSAAVAAAAAARVRLIPIPGAGPDRRPTEGCGEEVIAWLAAHLPGAVPTLWIGHDLITGAAAVAAAQKHGGTVALIHHADYLSYGNLAGGRGRETEAKRRAQTELFRSPGATLFGVGTWLAGNAADLAGTEAHMLLPGFPPEEPRSKQEEKLHAVVAGRFERGNEPLKRVLLAAEAFGEAVRLAGDNVRSMEDPTIVMLGVEDDRCATMEQAVRQRAGRPVNVVPGPFDPDPRAVQLNLLHANLAIMPSTHEGFGLIAWEAIGAEVPLILGTGSGLLRKLDELCGIGAEGWVFPVRIDGRAGEVEALAEAILKVARDIGRARSKAAALRSALKGRHGCTWENCAEQLLRAVGRLEPGRIGPNRAAAPATAAAACWHAPPPKNQFPLCTELSVSAGQGSTRDSLELIAELRFGVQELAHKGIEAEVSIAGATVRVTSPHGRIVGERLGDRTAAGIEARAGGVWLLTPPDGASRMPNRALGSEALCRISTPPGLLAHVQVEVTAARRDVKCQIRSRHRNLQRVTESVMAAFLKDAILQHGSNHIVLNFAELKEADE